jgi:hypothetical protein
MVLQIGVQVDLSLEVSVLVIAVEIHSLVVVGINDTTHGTSGARTTIEARPECVL